MNKILNIENLNYEELEIIDIQDSSNYTMDIEVENDHYYQLSNGIISHNSVSILLQTTSGIEPVFSIYYKRRRKLSSNSDIKVDFIDDLGDKWEEYNVIHPRFKDWYNVYCSVKNAENEKIAFHNPNSIIIDRSSELDHLSNKEMDELIKLSPYYKATANDLNWE